MPNITPETARPLCDRFARAVGRLGMPETAGRCVAWLLVCDPPCQTAEEVGQALGTTAEAVAPMLHSIAQTGVLEEVGRPGGAAPCYAVRSIEELMHDRIGQIGEFREVIDGAIADLKEKDAPAASRAKLEDLSSFYAFLERDMPELMARWRASRKGASMGR